MTETAAQKTKTLYNADTEQRFTFEINDDDARYEITQVYSGLPDEQLIEYDRLREVSLESEGNKTDLKTDSVEADDYLFNELCTDIEGYEDEKPENWKELVDHDEKKAGINKLLAVKIISSDKEKQLQKRSWLKKSSANTVELQSYFNGEVVTTKAIFGNKTPADTAAYAVIKSRVSLMDRNLDDSAIKIPASMKRKADLFKKLNPTVEGYDGRVPLHHQAAFVTGFFEPKISSAEKK